MNCEKQAPYSSLWWGFFYLGMSSSKLFSMPRFTAFLDLVRFINEGTGQRFLCGEIHGKGYVFGLDRLVFFHRPEHESREQWRKNNGDFFTEAELLTVTEQQGRFENVQRMAGPIRLISCLYFTFDAVVEDLGVGIRTECCDDQELFSPSSMR